ncbi:MAG: ABC transporter permease [Chloroflexi bacterium]|nr:ABC transporter permease [Chloroflexota bacterium]
MRYALRLILPRLGLSVITLLAVSLIIFWAVEWLPGDAATRILGQNATPERVKVLREQMRLDRPPWVRYGLWVSDFVRGNWGVSLVSHIPASVASAGGRTERPVADMVLSRLKNTLILATVALILYVPASLLLGVITAIYRGRRFADSLSVLVLVGTAAPEFVIGILLLLVFTVMIPWFPPLSLIDQAQSFPELLRMLALPAVTLTMSMTAYAVRMMQTSLIAVLDSDYVRMATLKGLSQQRVIMLHALPNALGPALRVTVINIAWLIGGVVLVENIFTFPGIGQLLVDSIRLLDTPVIEAIAMILASVYILANLGADLVTAALNPRLRTG